MPPPAIATPTPTTAVVPGEAFTRIWQLPFATDVTVKVADGPVPDAVYVAMPVHVVLDAVNVPI